MKTGLLGKSKKKKKGGGEGGGRTAKVHCWDGARATREHPESGPERRMQKTPKIKWEEEKGRGPSHWKSPEELAATAWEGELCNDCGSGSLRAWLPDTRKEPALGGPGGSSAVGSRPG